MKNIRLIAVLCLISSLFSCENELLVGPKVNRTVLLYMAADNTLSSFGYSNLKRIVEGAADGNLNGGNLLIYFDPGNDVPRLLQIREGADGTIRQDTIQTYEEENSASISVMRGILNDVVADYPAESYGLILWSHGTAWMPSTVLSDGMLRSFGQDRMDWMEVNDLVQALPDNLFDFILFDACYMASAEVYYALRNKADYLMGSPTEILADGFPYQHILKDLFTPTPGLQQVAEGFYNFYDRQSGNYRSASVSLIKTAPLTELAALTREIVRQDPEAVYALPLQDIQALDYLGGTNYHALYDYHDYISRLATPDQSVRLSACLEEMVVYKATTPNATYGTGRVVPITHFSGLSVYLPQKNLTKLNDWYKGLEWYEAVYK